MKLSDYIEAGLATIAVGREVFPGAGVFARPSWTNLGTPLATDVRRQVFGWRWIGERTHVFWIESLREDGGDEVWMTLTDGDKRLKARVGMYDITDQKRKDLHAGAYDDLRAGLQEEVDALAKRQLRTPEPAALRSHRALLLGYQQAHWQAVGAIAANDDEAALWAWPEWRQKVGFWATALAEMTVTPGAFMDYWTANGGNGQVWELSETTVKAPDAERAAELALRLTTPLW